MFKILHHKLIKISSLPHRERLIYMFSKLAFPLISANYYPSAIIYEFEFHACWLLD